MPGEFMVHFVQNFSNKNIFMDEFLISFIFNSNFKENITP